MSYDVTSARYVSEYKIEVIFENGKSGIVDFLPYIRRGGVFAHLENLEHFKQFSVHPELCVLTWGNEVDVAPETLYTEATGEPLPDWMQTEEAARNIA